MRDRRQVLFDELLVIFRAHRLDFLHRHLLGLLGENFQLLVEHLSQVGGLVLVLDGLFRARVAICVYLFVDELGLQELEFFPDQRVFVRRSEHFEDRFVVHLPIRRVGDELALLLELVVEDRGEQHVVVLRNRVHDELDLEDE